MLELFYHNKDKITAKYPKGDILEMISTKFLRKILQKNDFLHN